MSEQLLTAQELNVDVCVLGTGLLESLTAAAVARQGKRVLHLDSASSYGGSWRALNLAELEAWAVAESNSEPEAKDETTAKSAEGLAGATPQGFRSVPLALEPLPSCFRRRSMVWDPFQAREATDVQALKETLSKSSSSFSVDLVPRLLFGRSELVDVLVESGVSRYLEFQGLKSARVLTRQGLMSVPLTKSEIFQDPVLTLSEKRTLMRFMTSLTPFAGSLAFESPAQLGVDQARKVPGPAEAAFEGADMAEPWHVFLEKQKLSPRLQDFIIYAICLWDWLPPATAEGDSRLYNGQPDCKGLFLSASEGLKRLGEFISSLGMHGRGTGMPLLYPMYGVAEMAQGFTRMCALHGGTYALRTSVTALLASEEEDGSWSAKGLVTQRGEVIRAGSIITSSDHFRQRTERATDDRDELVVFCRRMTVLLDCPLLVEEGVNLCLVPPSALEPALGNVVNVLQLDWSTGTCPRGYSVAHISQAWRAPRSAAAAPNDASSKELCDPFSDLSRVLEALLSHCGGAKHCLFSCTYIHEPRSLQRWDSSSPDGQVLEACSRNQSLMVVADPPAVPLVLPSSEVSDARALFLKTPCFGHDLTAADFLKKPEHVRQEEERCNSMEELELFNEQMQKAERGPDPLQQIDKPTEELQAQAGLAALASVEHEAMKHGTPGVTPTDDAG